MHRGGGVLGDGGCGEVGGVGQRLPTNSAVVFTRWDAADGEGLHLVLSISVWYYLAIYTVHNSAT